MVRIVDLRAVGRSDHFYRRSRVAGRSVILRHRVLESLLGAFLLRLGRVSAGSIGLLSLAALVLMTLVCAIVWNLAYQRGARETAYSDAVLSHRNPKIWSRFVRSEIGR